MAKSNAQFNEPLYDTDLMETLYQVFCSLQDITFLLPDFYQHIGFVDDKSMPLPPVDEEEDDLFHSVAERSFSPDRASDFLKGKGFSVQPPFRLPWFLAVPADTLQYGAQTSVLS